MKKIKSTTFVFCLMACCIVGYAQSYTFQSDGNWLGATSVPTSPSWTGESFTTALEGTYFNVGSVNHANAGCGTGGLHYMWIGPDAQNPNGFTEVNDNPVYFRKHFSLISPNVTCGDLSIFADDYAEVYINGVEVAHTYTGGGGVSTWSTIVVSGSDFGPGGQFAGLLQCGDNVIALLGKNNEPVCWYVVFNWSLHTNDYSLATTHTNPSTCSGTGSATASITPATLGDTYTWSTGATTQSVSGLAPGTYTVTAYCAGTSCTASQSVTIAPASSISVSVAGSNPTSCPVTGSATATVTGATGPVTYVWSTGATTGPTSTYTNTISGLTLAGLYTVTVTEGACVATASTTISTPAVTFAVSVSKTDPTSCSATGTATAIVAGSTGPFTYVWSTGASTTGTSSTTNTISGLPVGTYSVTVYVGASCSYSATTTLSLPQSHILTVHQPTCTSTSSSSGSATVTVSGTTDPVTYTWSNGTTFSSTTGPTTTYSNTVSGLLAGLYTLTIADGSCIWDTAFFIFPPTVPFTVNADSTEPTCSYNGSVSVTVSPSTAGPFTYTWSTGTPVNTPAIDPTTSTISNLGGGLYFVTVSTGVNCYTVKAITLFNPPATYSVAATSTEPTCSYTPDGTVTATVTPGGSGTVTYTYNWSTGASTTTTGTTNTITGLGAGVYTVTVTNNVTTCSSSVSVTLVAPTALFTASVAGKNPSCSSLGSATASISPITSGVSYVWSNGATTQSISGLTAGTYTVTASTGTTCTATASITLLPPSFTVVATGTDPTCTSPGKATADVVPGAPGTIYNWSNGVTAQTITGLGAGTYTVTATTSTCSATASVTLVKTNCCDSSTIHATISGSNDTSLCINSILALTMHGGSYGRIISSTISTPWGPWGTGGIFAVPDTGLTMLIVPDTFTIPGVYTICYVAYTSDPDSTSDFCPDTACITVNIKKCPCTAPAESLTFLDTSGDSTSTICEGSIYYLNIYSSGVWGQLLVDGSTANGIDTFPFAMIPPGGLPVGPVDTPLAMGPHRVCLVAHSTFFDGELADCPDTLCKNINIENCACQATQGTNYLISYQSGPGGVTYAFYDSFTSTPPNFINWIVDDSVIKQTTASDTFGHTFGPGHHTICMQTATILQGLNGDNICCYNRYCQVIDIDACAIWKATDTITYVLSPTNIDSVTFTFQGNTTPPPTIVWNFGDNTTLVSTDLSVTHVYSTDPLKGNKFKVCADVIWSKGDSINFDSLGVCCCMDEICFIAEVTVCNIPTFTVAKVSGDPSTGAYTFEVEYTNGIVYIEPPYKWEATDGNTASGTVWFNDNITSSGPDTICAYFKYQVEYDGQKPVWCEARACLDTILTAPKQKDGFRAYPNPNNGQMIVEITNYQNVQTAKIEITDIAGQPVLVKTINNLGVGVTQNYMNISNLPQGVYLLRMTIGDVQQITKLIRE